MNAHVRKLERSQINNLMIYLKLLTKQEQDKEMKKSTNNQQNKMMVLWKNKQGWKTPGNSDENEEWKDPNQ
jgi:hypothetical protein